MKLFVGPEGPVNAQIVLIGEAAGETEENEGRPFVGKSGQLLNECLLKADLRRDECYVTNIVKYRPTDNATPSDDELEKWRPLLIEELRLVKPQVIVTLGASALKALTLNYDVKITKERGKSGLFQLGEGFGSTIIIPAFHPSYCLRSGSAATKLLVEDLAQAARAIGRSQARKGTGYHGFL